MLIDEKTTAEVVSAIRERAAELAAIDRPPGLYDRKISMKDAHALAEQLHAVADYMDGAAIRVARR